MSYEYLDDNDVLAILRDSDQLTYSVRVFELEDNPYDNINNEDRLLVYRDGEPYSVTYERMMADDTLEDDDLFLIERGGVSYTITWAMLVGEFALREPTFNITQNTPGSVSVRSGAGTSFRFGIETTGEPTVTYQWYWSGSPISGATGADFLMNPWYVSDTGKTLQCIATITKAGYETLTATSNSTSISVEKSNNGGSFLAISDGSDWLGESGYPNNGQYTWMSINSDKEDTGSGEDQWRQLHDLGNFRREHCTHMFFVRDGCQMEWAKKDFGDRGQCNQSNGSECWDSDGQGWSGNCSDRWAIKGNNQDGSNGPGDGIWQVGNFSRNYYFGHETDNGHEVQQHACKGSSTGSFAVPIQEVPEGNATQTPTEYRPIAQGIRYRMEEWYKNGGKTGRTGYKGMKWKWHNSNECRARGAPYQYAYVERSGNPPGNTGYAARFEDDRWYSSSRSDGENAEYASARNAYSFVLEKINDVWHVNGKVIEELVLTQYKHYTFFVPDAPNAVVSLRLEPELDSMSVGDNHMFSVTPRKTSPFFENRVSLKSDIGSLDIKVRLINTEEEPLTYWDVYPFVEPTP